MDATSALVRLQMFLQNLVAVLIYPFLLLKDFIVLHRRHFKFTEKIPGDSAYPIIGNIFNMLPGNAESLSAYLLNGYVKFGTLYKMFIGPILVVVSAERDEHEMILSGNEFMGKGLIYKFLEPWLGTGLLISTGEKWRTRRKMLTPAFHFKILDQFVPVFNACGNEFVAQLRRRADGRPVNVWTSVKLLTLDIICETTMGVKMNAQTIKNSEYVEAVSDFTQILCEISLKPWLRLPIIFQFSKVGRRYKKSLGILHGTTDRVIRERREEMDFSDNTLDADELGRRRRVAFLDLLLLMARDGGLSDEDIREEVDTFMFEGHDTTASAIAMTIHALAENPQVQEKVHAELEATFDASKPLEPTIPELSNLKYLEMVIKESLRIWPPVSAIGRKITRDLPLKSSDVSLPEETNLFLSFWELHRNPKVFPDPLKFDPERFSPDEVARRHPYAYLPFSAGSRNCIGQRFAMLEMKSIIAKLVWNFRILQDKEFEPILIWEVILRTKNGISVRLEDRNTESKASKNE